MTTDGTDQSAFPTTLGRRRAARRGADDRPHFIGGHLGRLGTRDDVTLHLQYMADISESSRKSIDTVGTRPVGGHLVLTERLLEA